MDTPSFKEDQISQIPVLQFLHVGYKEKQLLKTKTEKPREKKKGLMQVLLTGEKRLLE